MWGPRIVGRLRPLPPPTQAKATTIDYSWLEVTYRYSTNESPHPPVLTLAPVGCTYSSDDLTVAELGPFPADPAGDAVSYE